MTLFAEIDFPRRRGVFEVATLPSIIKDAISLDAERLELLPIASSRRATPARLWFARFSF